MLENQDQTSNAGADKALADSKAAKARFENRRRLLKAMAVAAPLIITLRGKPAHAQLSSLGSAGITYGPGAYVTQDDIDANPTILGPDDLGKAVKIDGSQKTVISDKTRRNQNTEETVNIPDSPNNGQTKSFND